MDVDAGLDPRDRRAAPISGRPNRLGDLLPRTPGSGNPANTPLPENCAENPAAIVGRMAHLGEEDVNSIFFNEARHMPASMEGSRHTRRGLPAASEVHRLARKSLGASRGPRTTRAAGRPGIPQDSQGHAPSSARSSKTACTSMIATALDPRLPGTLFDAFQGNPGSFRGSSGPMSIGAFARTPHSGDIRASTPSADLAQAAS